MNSTALKKSRRAFFFGIFFVLFSFDVLFLIDIFIEILVDLLAVLRNNTERAKMLSNIYYQFILPLRL